MRDENRVVAEAGRAGHLAQGDTTFVLAAGQFQAYALGDRDHADEAGAASFRRRVAQRVQQLLTPLRHAQVGAAPARRINAGRAIQRIDEEAGVVGEGRQAAVGGPDPRLVRRVGLQAVAVFGDVEVLQAQVRGTDQLQRQRRQQLAILLQFAGVAGRDEQGSQGLILRDRLSVKPPVVSVAPSSPL